MYPFLRYVKQSLPRLHPVREQVGMSHRLNSGSQAHTKTREIKEMKETELPEHVGNGSPSVPMHEHLAAQIKNKVAPSGNKPLIYGANNKPVTTLEGITAPAEEVIQKKLKDERSWRLSRDDSNKNRFVNTIKYLMVVFMMLINGSWAYSYALESAPLGGSGVGGIATGNPVVDFLLNTNWMPWGYVGVILVGPILAIALFQNIVNGKYLGWEKRIAALMCGWILYEEYVTGRAITDPVYVTQLTEFVIPAGFLVIFSGIFLLKFFNLKHKTNRDIAEARMDVEQAQWKQAYGRQIDRIKREEIGRRLQSVSHTIGNAVTMVYTVAATALLSLVVKIPPSYRAALKNLGDTNSDLAGEDERANMVAGISPANPAVNVAKIAGSRDKDKKEKKWLPAWMKRSVGAVARLRKGE